MHRSKQAQRGMLASREQMKWMTNDMKLSKSIAVLGDAAMTRGTAVIAFLSKVNIGIRLAVPFVLSFQ
jgi:deoxyxylulose-5-phosphate synthase